MFKTVMIDVLDKLHEEEVREMILRRDDDDGHSLLTKIINR